MNDIYLVAAKRTPFGKYHGFLQDKTAVDLGVMALRETLKSSKIAPAELDALFMGNVLGTGLGQNMARQVALRSGMADTSAATTINEVCGSSLKALRLAQGQMVLGDLELVAVGGAESMSNAPYYAQEEMAPATTSTMLHDGLYDNFFNGPMGLSAEKIADRHKLTRTQMDKYAAASHEKAVKALAAGAFTAEIIPLTLAGETLAQDQTIRPETTLSALAKLKPAFKPEGKVSAGNSSPVSDGASMVILASGNKVKELGLKPLGRLGAFAESGTDPAYMGYAPYYAVKKLLAQTGRSTVDYDIIELNEAFAAPSLAVIKDLKLDPAKVNIAGGALALGHPLAASGTRLVMTACYNLVHIGGRRALVTLCIGGGQAIAYEIIRD